jgi:hypothetical protein
MRAPFSFAPSLALSSLLAPLLATALAALTACGEPGPVRVRIGDGPDPAEGEGEPGEGEGEPGEGEGEGEPGEGEGEGEIVDEGGELRGLWITRFAFSSEATLRGILERAADAGFNAVFLQIRGNGDAYYSSSIEPWARGLTGVLGRDPGWDPLAVAVEHGHALGLEVHAYFNVLSAWPSSLALPPVAEGQKPHMLAAHPEWLVVDDQGAPASEEYYWVTPGNPAVRAHTAAVARDLLERYEVDGLHLDRIRTPGRRYSHDEVTEAAFQAARAAAPGLSFGDFMREQVTLTVAELYAVITEVRPAARLSAAVWGIHTALPGCSTSQGSADYHQDSWAWLERGVIDALVPMTYWPIEPGACTDWAALTDGFLEHRAGRQIWMGMHALDGGAFDFPRIEARIDYARAVAAHGTVVFASTHLDQGVGRWGPFSAGPFAEPARPPRIGWR